MKILEKIKGSKVFKKVCGVIASAAVAVSAVAVNAFAEETSSSTSVSSALSEIGPKLITGFGELVSSCIDIGVSVIPLGLTIFGALKLWDVAKKFFTKATN